MARRGQLSYHHRAEPGGRHYNLHDAPRSTVSSAVSPVGPDLVGTSVAVGERVSPQRSPFEGAARASRIAPRPVFRCHQGTYVPMVHTGTL